MGKRMPKVTEGTLAVFANGASETPTSGLVRKAEDGDKGALAEIIARTDASPNAREVWAFVGDLGKRAERRWIEVATFGNPLARVGLERIISMMRADLEGDAPSPLERLLIERIILCWLQANFADQQVAALLANGEGKINQVEFFERRQGRAQRRYLAAIRSLALLRRLLVPSIRVEQVGQLNIARSQVNVATRENQSLQHEPTVQLTPGGSDDVD